MTPKFARQTHPQQASNPLPNSSSTLPTTQRAATTNRVST